MGASSSMPLVSIFGPARWGGPALGGIAAWQVSGLRARWPSGRLAAGFLAVGGFCVCRGGVCCGSLGVAVLALAVWRRGSALACGFRGVGRRDFGCRGWLSRFWHVAVCWPSLWRGARWLGVVRTAGRRVRGWIAGSGFSWRARSGGLDLACHDGARRRGRGRNVWLPPAWGGSWRRRWVAADGIWPGTAVVATVFSARDFLGFRRGFGDHRMRLRRSRAVSGGGFLVSFFGGFFRGNLLDRGFFGGGFLGGGFFRGALACGGGSPWVPAGMVGRVSSLVLVLIRSQVERWAWRGWRIRSRVGREFRPPLRSW